MSTGSTYFLCFAIFAPWFKQNVLHTTSIIIRVTGINAAVTSNEKAWAVPPSFLGPWSVLAGPLFSPRPFCSLIPVTT